MGNKYLGNAMLLYIEQTPGSGIYQIIGGTSDHTLNINNELLDVSDKDSNRWKESLSAGARGASISMNGFISDNTYYELLETSAKNDTILFYQFIFSDSRLVIGEFHINSFEGSGSNQTAQSFSATFESKGQPMIGKLADFLLDENSANILDENNQYIQAG